MQIAGCQHTKLEYSTEVLPLFHVLLIVRVKSWSSFMNKWSWLSIELSLKNAFWQSWDLHMSWDVKTSVDDNFEDIMTDFVEAAAFARLCKLCASRVMIIKCLVLLTVNSRVKKMFFPREWIARCQFFGFSPLASSSVVSLPKSPIWLLRIAVLFKNRNLHPYSASFWNYSYFNFYVHVRNWNIEVGRKKG